LIGSFEENDEKPVKGGGGDEKRGREETEEEAARTRKFLKGAEDSHEYKPEDSEEEADGEKVEAGRRRTQKMQDPVKPSEDEVREHSLTHLPYRSWCRHCVRGRCKSNPHKAGQEKPTRSELHFDYCFLGKEGEPHKTLPVLAVTERITGMRMGAAVPTKTTGTYSASRVMAFMKEVGCEYGDLTAKSDQEPAIQKVIADVGKLRAFGGGGKFVLENSPVGSSASNGVVERAIQSITGQARVLLDALESRWQVSIPYGHPILCYIIEYSAFLLNRFEVGHDGMTAIERCKGKKAKTIGIEMGEAIFWKRKLSGGALGKLTVTWEDGIYLGIRGRSGEVIVGDGKGVWKARSVQRKPVGDRWDPTTSDLVKHVPWRTSDEDPKVDGEKPEVVKLTPDGEQLQREVMRETVPRKVAIAKQDLEEFGYTAKCPGCLAVLRGTTRQGHSQDCRRRMQEELKGTPKADAAKRKFESFTEEALEKDDMNRKQKKRDETERSEMKKTEDVRNDKRKSREDDEQPGNAKEANHSTSASSSRTPAVETAKRKSEDDFVSGERRRKIMDAQGDKRDREGAEGDSGREKRIFVGELEVNQEDEISFSEYYDDKDGKALDSRLVRAAEKEELDFMEKLVVGEECPEGECWEKTGKEPTSTKFVHVNKSAAGEPDIRARLVARDFKPKGEKDRCDLFAAMPPLEAKKLLFRMAAKSRKIWRRGKWRKMKVMFIDVKKAHLNGRVPEDVFAYVKLPDGRCWRLKRWLYGMRPAASAWENDFAERLESIGFVRGKSATTVFFNPTTSTRCVVHGDDFTFLGYDIDLKDVAARMREWYEIKVRGTIGDEPGDDSEMTILNRRVEWKDGVITYEADSKHAKVIIEEMGVQDDSKGLEMPIEREELTEGWTEDDDEPMNDEDAKKFRGLAATANYLAQDRTDIQFAAKEICRSMSKPKEPDWKKLKRLARYLLEFPRFIYKFRDDLNQGVEFLDIFSDSDWAGDKKTRKSTSGGIASIAGGALKSWASTQGSIALSSGEAEYYSLVKAAAEGLGIQALAKDLGYDLQVRIWVDSTAAKSIVSRIGLGRVRHLEVKYLWAQEAHKRNRFTVRKIAGDRNPGDVLTKPLSISEMEHKLEAVGGFAVRRSKKDGRPEGRGKLSWADMSENQAEDSDESWDDLVKE